MQDSCPWAEPGFFLPARGDQLEPKLPPQPAVRGEGEAGGVLQAQPGPRRFALQVDSCLLLGRPQEGQATLLKPGVALLLGPWNSVPRPCLSPMGLEGSAAGGRRARVSPAGGALGAALQPGCGRGRRSEIEMEG